MVTVPATRFRKINPWSLFQPGMICPGLQSIDARSLCLQRMIPMDLKIVHQEEQSGIFAVKKV